MLDALKMPDFIPTCKKNDPNLNKCAVTNANLALPGLLKGSRAYGLPNLVPLQIPRIEIQAGNNLNVDLTDNEISGLEGTVVTAVEMQLDKQHMIFRVNIPRANILGRYKMDGNILILPIKGEGPANITFIDGDYVYSMDYVMKQRNKKQYLTIVDHKITFTTTRAYYDFKNLFNGDSRLGQEMNKFLDENWAEVTKDLGSTVGETISSIITSIAMSVFTKVPFDEVLPVD
ncbi:uncharacterized protein CBL_12706 [Carabus blaptoides fortunei]